MSRFPQLEILEIFYAYEIMYRILESHKVPRSEQIHYLAYGSTILRLLRQGRTSDVDLITEHFEKEMKLRKDILSEIRASIEDLLSQV